MFFFQHDTKVPRYVLTGFGPFGDVPENPSSEIAREVARVRRDIVTCISDLRVSVSGVQEALEEVKTASSSPLGPVYVIHFGVDTSATKIKLEKFAYNEKTFRIPDADGNTCYRERIVHSGPEILETPIDLAHLVSLDPRLSLSTDPGRYICNLLYYESLYAGFSSLFVHIPPFAVLPKQDQLGLIQRILDSLA